MLDLIRTVAARSELQGPASKKQVAVIVRGLNQELPKRWDRVGVLSYCFDRKIDSTYDLTMAEASALIAFLYEDEWRVNPFFIDQVVKPYKEQRNIQ